MKILAVGDVFGSPGRKAIRRWLRRTREEEDASFVIVNVENIYNGRGVDHQGVRDVLDAGADCLTSGNHVWGLRDHEEVLGAHDRLIRPANYPEPCPGRGALVLESSEGVRVGVFNLQGRVFMSPVDDPFRAADGILEEWKDRYDVAVLDFHAEATSEKQALARYLDGRIAAVFGTHTHVQTADARVLARGTGYISDLGMTGPYDSVIGMAPRAALQRFTTGRSSRTVPAEGEIGLRGALFEIDESSGRCIDVRRIVRGAGGQ